MQNQPMTLSGGISRILVHKTLFEMRTNKACLKELLVKREVSLLGKGRKVNVGRYSNQDSVRRHPPTSEQFEVAH
ncbi:unnamed protein product [Protopolystoma xenopodis]|uniref:Uncharacterized protein n=1 Tax=Protopolystoma xenopodis TaxID=117903 RepID=A0A3S5CVI9_9PLAT|nr:unnamed protein product [Protopolystoma xenopodis]